MKKLLLFSFLFFCSVIYAQPINPNPNIWKPDGMVKDIKIDGDYTYIGGNFSYVGPTTGTGVKTSTNNSQINNHFPKVDKNIFCVVPDGNGGWYIGGDFTRVGESPRNYIAQINSDGTVNSWNPNAAGGISYTSIHSIVVDSGCIYIGGNFGSVGGQQRKGIAKLNKVTGLADPAWSADITGTGTPVINSLVLTGNYLYVGGNFQHIKGLDREGAAKLNKSTGALVIEWNVNLGSETSFVLVSEIAAAGDDIYIGGYFNSVSSLAISNFTKVNSNTGSPSTIFNPNPNGLIYEIVLEGNDLYVGGYFTSIGGQNRTSIAKLNSLNGVADNWNAYLDTNYTKINCILINGSDMFIGGNFRSIGGVVRNHLAKLDINSALASQSWYFNADNVVNDIAINGSDLYVGGGFNSIGGEVRKGVAKINNKTGIVDHNWNPDITSTNAQIKTIKIIGNDIYLGGYFNIIGGQARNGLAKLNKSTGEVYAWDPAPSGWDPAISGYITQIENKENEIFIGGSFTSVGGNGIKYLAKVNSESGIADANWNPMKNYSKVNMLKVFEDKLFVGGVFDSVGGQSRKNLVSVNTTTGEVNNNWAPNPSGEVYTGLVNGNDIYIGGSFSTIGGKAKKYLAKMDINNAVLDTSFSPGPNSTVLSLAMNEDNIFVAGIFNFIGNNESYGLAKINKGTFVTDTSWHPQVAEIRNVIVDGTDVYTGNNFPPFLSLFTDRPVYLEEHTTSDNSIDYALEQNYPNPFNPATTITFTLPVNEIATLKVYNLLGEEVGILINEFLSAGKHSFNFDAMNLPSGVYFYQIEAGAYTQAKKMLLVR